MLLLSGGIFFGGGRSVLHVRFKIHRYIVQPALRKNATSFNNARLRTAPYITVQHRTEPYDTLRHCTARYDFALYFQHIVMINHYFYPQRHVYRLYNFGVRTARVSKTSDDRPSNHSDLYGFREHDAAGKMLKTTVPAISFGLASTAAR